MNVTAIDDNDDYQDIIWPTIVGIFVALALGWMVCRYRFSSQSPHAVQCCPKSLCKKLRLCCCRCKFNDEPAQRAARDSRSSINSKARSSNNSTMETAIMTNNSRLILTQQQWPPTFLVNGNRPAQPKRHPLRRESVLPQNQGSGSSWPFPITNVDFHNQTKEIKKNDLFLST